jgi:elongation of very long chain fatty acids protein 7
VHCIRALYTDCDFPWFLTVLLLLNASIFFALFMNFYIQNYKKQKEQLLLRQTATKKLS